MQILAPPMDIPVTPFIIKDDRELENITRNGKELTCSSLKITQLCSLDTFRCFAKARLAPQLIELAVEEFDIEERDFRNELFTEFPNLKKVKIRSLHVFSDKNLDSFVTLVNGIKNQSSIKNLSLNLLGDVGSVLINRLNQLIQEKQFEKLSFKISRFEYQHPLGAATKNIKAWEEFKKRIGDQKSLTSLKFSINKIDFQSHLNGYEEERRQILSAITKHPNLHKVSIPRLLKGASFDYAAQEGSRRALQFHEYLEILLKQGNLKEVNLSDNGLSSPRICHLLNKLCQNVSITDLNLSGNDLAGFGGFFFEELNKTIKMSQLKKLNLANMHAGQDKKCQLADALSNNCKLTELDLQNLNMGKPALLAIIAALKTNQTLCYLNLLDEKAKLSSDDLPLLYDCLTCNQTIQTLIIGCEKLSEEEAQGLFNFSKERRVEFGIDFTQFAFMRPAKVEPSGMSYQDLFL